MLKLQFTFKMQKRLGFFFLGGGVVKRFHFPHLETVVMCCCCTAPEYLKRVCVCALGRNVRLYKAHWHMHINTAPTRYVTALSIWSLGRKACPGTVCPHWCDEYQKCLPTTFPFTLNLTQEELLPLTPETGPTLQMIWHEASPTLEALLRCERRSCSEFALSGNSYLYITHLFFPLAKYTFEYIAGIGKSTVLSTLQINQHRPFSISYFPAVIL